MVKKTKKIKKEEEPIDDLTNLTQEKLNENLILKRERYYDIKTKRNYAQQEKDYLNNFYINTIKETEEIKDKIIFKENEIQKIDDEHKTEIRVYMQKIKHLEFEAEKNEEKLRIDEEETKKKEDDYKENMMDELKVEKKNLKNEMIENEEKYLRDIETKTDDIKLSLKKTKIDYKNKIIDQRKKYEDQLFKLQRDLELKLRAEIHEIEERKNLHINELILSFKNQFEELKSFYNVITAQNLKLIKTQREQISKSNQKHENSLKEMTKIRKSNKDLENPLKQALIEKESLEKLLKKYLKDQMSLANLTIKETSLKEKKNKIIKEKIQLDEEYEKIFNNKVYLEDKFDNLIQEMKELVDKQNIVLIQKLREKEDDLISKETEITQIINTGNLDPKFVNNILEKIKKDVKNKNAIMANLKYLIHHATKAYNDSIRVYEAKLVEFGIPQEELGFQPIESITSNMPAGLVSS